MDQLTLHFGFSISKRIFISVLSLIFLLTGIYTLQTYAQTKTIYAATYGGLSISTDAGESFNNKTIADGLGDNRSRSVFSNGDNVYAATYNGLSISIDGGESFVNKTTADGLGDNSVWNVIVVDSVIYTATFGGLSISVDGGNSFTNRTTANGLGNNWVYSVFVDGNNVYAATAGGLSISTNGGDNFTNKNTSNGLGSNIVRDVYVNGNFVYAATFGGLSISQDGGNSFTNLTVANGLANNNLWDVEVNGSSIFAATYGDGLSISADGGSNFTVKTSANGLGNDWVYSIFLDDSDVYVATIDGGLSISTDGGNNFITKTTANGLADNWVFDVFVYTSAPPHQLTPQEAINQLIADVQALYNSGLLTPDQSNGLISKLREAINKLNTGKNGPAISSLQAFINQVQAFVRNGNLNSAYGQPLIDKANVIIALINGLRTFDIKHNHFKLEKNYPNPFNPSTTIRYTISEQELVKLEVFNIIGESVAELVNEVKSPGTYDVIFDADNLPSGIYLYKLQAGNFIEFRKMLLMK